MSSSAIGGAPTVGRRATAWSPGPAQPGLLDSAVDVWRVDLATVDAGLGELLSHEERKRAERISRADQRELWQRSRGLLRALLARYVHAEPQTLQIASGPHGKPELPAHGGSDKKHARLWFNLSHSRALALYVVAAHGPVGVDVQYARDPGTPGARDHVALATRSFGANQAHRLAELDAGPREAEFIRLWTRYEAELKRRGTGIGATGSRASEQDASSWITELDVGPDAAAALSCTLAPRELRLWLWH